MKNQFQHQFKRRFGQNFLRTNRFPIEIAETLAPEAGESIIEIGPGRGILTEELVKTPASIYSIEIDKELFPYLLAKYGPLENFKLINKDILRLDVESAGQKNYKVTGSLPYNISKKIIDKFLHNPNKPTKMVFIIQKEVAQEYVSEAPKSSFLGMMTQLYCDIRIVDIIKNFEFFPIPEVDGAIIEFTNLKPKFENIAQVKRLIKLGYLQPRKKLSANLATVGYDKKLLEELFVKLGLSENCRASELGLQQWYELSLEIESTHP